MRLWFKRETKTPVLTLKTVNISPETKRPLNTSVSECCFGFQETATEYCISSSLHGLQYMGRTGHYRRERWFWLLTLLMSTGTAFYLIVKMYLDYSRSPVETVFNPTPRRLQEIPFPAITICDATNWLSEATFINYTREIFQKPPESVLSEEEIRNLAKASDMVDLCWFGFQMQEMISTAKKLKPYFDAYKHQIQSLSNHLQTIADESQGCKQLITACVFKTIDCMEHITGIVTDMGYCCVFNSVPITQLTKYRNETSTQQEHWSAIEMPPLDHDDLLFIGEDETADWPLKLKSRGQMEGLIVQLQHTATPSICPRLYPNRTYVYVTSQLDLPPLLDTEVGYIERWGRADIKVQPDITLSDSTVKLLSKDKRKCYFGDEFKLQWHKHYTQSNCIEECRLMETIELCNCTTVYGMPFKRFCNRFTSQCHLDQARRWQKAGNILARCAWCLPTCTEIQYNSDVVTTQISPTLNVPAVSQVFVSMGVNMVHPKLRKQSMTTIQLLSNAGGLLGLFLGFSVFSLLEILYYSTLCIRRARGGGSSTI